ncbi:hypothetical protein PFISCL1PPCAC_9139, partial [Pristionchus fissidentatus]
CPGPRGSVVFRNSTSIWLPTSSIRCGPDGVLRNSAGAKLFAGTPTLVRPTCGYKAACDACTYTEEKTLCPAGYICPVPNVMPTIAEDGCRQLECHEGSLTFYENGAQSAYKASKLYCTTSGLWSNFSIDGGMSGGEVINRPFSVNCILPVGCQHCSTPTMATTLTQLPTTFRTGYSITPAIYRKEAGSCSVVVCPTGYKLHGFSGTNTSVTGLEYTQRGWMECAANSMWTDGRYAYTPQSMVAACLRKEHECGCTYSQPTCSECFPELVSKQPLAAGQLCALTCPAGYLMKVFRYQGGPQYFVHGMTCDGALWTGRYWLAGYEVSFQPDDAYFTCVTSPIENGLTWPLEGMDCPPDICQNHLLLGVANTLKCSRDRTQLVVSSSRSALVNTFELSSVTWTGAIWSGLDAKTGEVRAFPPSVYFTCYNGTVPEPVTTPCGCTYNLRTCADGSCDGSLIAKLPLESGMKCTLGCPPGHRIVVRVY